MYNQLIQSLIQDTVINNYVPDVLTIDKYFTYLRKKFKFGDSCLANEIHNDTRKKIFDIAIRPCLRYAQSKLDIDLYSRLDHYLFQSYICSIEDLEWFSNAFWDVNSYGLAIARNIRTRNNIKPKSIISNTKKILFVHKGPFALAHSNVLGDFLDGIKDSEQNSEVHLLLLDAQPFFIDSVKVTSFANLLTVSKKLLAYIQFCSNNSFSNIIWVACIQNLALYMGVGLSDQQSYWTMKRHSIVFPEITKYATFISQYRNQIVNDTFWFGGRYRLKTIPTSKSKLSILDSLSPEVRNKVTGKFIYGSLARSQKYHNLDYWKGVEVLLLNTESSMFIYGSQDLPISVKKYIFNSNVLSKKSINFGWLDGKTADIASLIQIYVDTVPFGSGLTSAECVLGGGCYLGTLSEINKEASFTNVLVDALNISSKKQYSYNSNLPECGIFKTFDECISAALELSQNVDKASRLHQLQKTILMNLDSSGKKYFTSDYLNYFLSDVSH